MRRTLAVAAVAAMFPAIAAAAGVRIGDEDGGNDSYPAVCRQPAGFVTAWETDGEDGREVIVRQLNENGRPFRGLFRANQQNAGDQQLPDVACRDDGSFLVVWEAEDGDGLGIYARDFAADGTPNGDEFRVNTHTVDNQRLPRVCIDDSGRAIAVWQSDGQGAEHPRVFGQRFDAAGLPLGAEFGVENNAAYDQNDPAVACATEGAFAVAWTSRTTDPGSQIWVRLFDSDGSPVHHVTIPRTPDAVQRRHPDLEHNPVLDFERSFALAFEADGQVQAGWVLLDEGTPRTVEMSVVSTFGRNEAPAVAGHGQNAIAAWSSGSVFEFSLEGARTRFRSDTRTFSVSSRGGTNHGANSPLGRGIDIAVAPDGDLVVWQERKVFAWADSSSAIYAQRYRDCIGDCSGDGVVAINELIAGVRIALQVDAVSICTRLDANDSGTIEISELVRAVTEALARMCPAPVDANAAGN